MHARLCILLAALLVSGQALAGAVVVGKDARTSGLDAEQARRVFLGRQAGLNGQPVVVVYQKSGPVREHFDKQVLEKAGAELSNYWARLIFTGKARAPEEVSGDAEVKAFVNRTPGAFGYVDDSAIDASVKVLFRF